jgi:hypothetical protein
MDIYEFRTGFTYRVRAESWDSSGFYGSQYVGISFPGEEIPDEIIRAVNGEGFKGSPLVDMKSFYQEYDENRPIGSKAFNEKYVQGIALIGRVLKSWSVLAVISGAIDFAGRYFPVTRYFCCQRHEDKNYDSMTSLIAWWADNKLVFDILENSPANVYQGYNVSSSALEDVKSINKITKVTERLTLIDNKNILTDIYTPEKSNLFKIWKTTKELAQQKSSEKRIRPDWAYNVVSLSRPQIFILVLPGSQEYYEQLKSHQNVDDSNSRIVQDKNLDDIIAEFRENQTLNPNSERFLLSEIRQNHALEDWEELFDKVNLDFYQEREKISYLVLQALLIPQRLKDLFTYLSRSNNPNNWQQYKELQEYLSKFQDKPEIQTLLQRGIWNFLNAIVKRELGTSKLDDLKVQIFCLKSPESTFLQASELWVNSLIPLLQSLLSFCRGSIDLHKFAEDAEEKYISEFFAHLSRKRKPKLGYSILTNFLKASSNKNPNNCLYPFFRAVIEQNALGGIAEELDEYIRNTINLRKNNPQQESKDNAKGLQNFISSCHVKKSWKTWMSEILEIIKALIHGLLSPLLSDTKRLRIQKREKFIDKLATPFAVAVPTSIVILIVLALFPEFIKVSLKLNSGNFNFIQSRTAMIFIGAFFMFLCSRLVKTMQDFLIYLFYGTFALIVLLLAYQFSPSWILDLKVAREYLNIDVLSTLRYTVALMALNYVGLLLIKLYNKNRV